MKPFERSESMEVKVEYYYAISGDYFEDRVILENVDETTSDADIEALAKEDIYKKKRHTNVKIRRLIKT